MSDQFTGIIPYGSTDSSVILQCSMTSLAAVTAAGGVEVTTGSNTYDSMRGVSPSATNGGVKFSNVTGYADLNTAGQASMEVETFGICINNTVAPSTGKDWASNTIFFTMRETAGGTTPANYFRWYQDVNERPVVQQFAATVSGGTSPSSVTLELTSTGKSTYSVITFSWCGNQYDMYVDGRLVFSGTRAGRYSGNIAERIDFMSGANTTFGAPVGIYGRNLIVSKRPVMLPKHNQLAKIGIIGHSFATRFKSTNTANLSTDTWRDEPSGLAMLAELAKYGVGAGFPLTYTTVQDVPGGEILNSAATTINSKVAAAVADNCSVYVYLGGTNDVIQPDWSVNRAAVLADLKTQITTLMAAPNAKLMIIHNVISTSGNVAVQNDGNVLQINTDMGTLPAWWNTNNPTRAGQLVLLDDFEAFGGLTPHRELIQGFVAVNTTSYLADSHPSAAGILLMGRMTAKAIIQALGT